MMMRKWRGGSYRNIPVAAVTINVTTTLYHDHHRWLEQDSNKPGIAQDSSRPARWAITARQ